MKALNSSQLFSGQACTRFREKPSPAALLCGGACRMLLPPATWAVTAFAATPGKGHLWLTNHSGAEVGSEGPCWGLDTVSEPLLLSKAIRVALNKQLLTAGRGVIHHTDLHLLVHPAPSLWHCPGADRPAG